MQFDLVRSGGVLLALIALGVAAMFVSDMMAPNTVLMMVLPSMLLFGAVAFALGVKHGEFRATR